MLKKVLAAAAVSLVLATPSFAATNNGFETADVSNWAWDSSTSSLTRYQSGDNVSIFVTNPSTYVDEPITVSVDAAAGNYFGVFSTTGTSSITMSLVSPAAQAGDRFYFSLLSGDLGISVANGGDSASVSFAQGGTSLSTSSINTGMSDPTVSYPQGAWYYVDVPTGATSYTVTLSNGDSFNPAALALDYQVATPVPEPESAALMLAGIGALGFMSRRRSKKSA
jgi:hypothetical protein